MKDRLVDVRAPGAAGGACLSSAGRGETEDGQRRCQIAAGTHGHEGSDQGAVRGPSEPGGPRVAHPLSATWKGNIPVAYGHVFFRGTRVASDSGVFVVQLRVPDWVEVDGLVGKAVDRQTGQVCKAFAWGAPPRPGGREPERSIPPPPNDQKARPKAPARARAPGERREGGSQSF